MAILKAADPSSWQSVYKRINAKRKEAGLSWNQLAKQAGIKVSSWMTGLPYCHPSEEDVRKIAPVVNTIYEYLRFGTENA